MLKRKLNNSEHFKREVLIEIAKMFLAGNLKKDIHKIPFKIIPKDSGERVRCCEYKERAILQYRILAALGYSVNETDETKHLNEYAEQKNLNNKEGKLLTVLGSACKGCVKSRFLVTEVCQGCISRACQMNCPFKAIKFENNRAVIDQDKCKNCGKCRSSCPYGAILQINVPCEDVCPVDAIKKDEKGFANIDHSVCISCGKCMKACPFGAVMERSQILNVLKSFAGNKPVVAMVAPAMAGQFGVSIGTLVTALKKIGFHSVYEVAQGAEITAEKESKEFKERVIEGGQKFMTSSCCFAYLRLVSKHMTELQPYVSHTATPMHYTAEIVKKEIPGAVTVFIGPCLSKQKEGQLSSLVDFVINFEELYAVMVAKKINLTQCTETKDIRRCSGAALRFPVSGGVTKAVKQVSPENTDIKAELINGIDKKTILKLKAYAAGNCPANFLEIMTCQGGCVGGPDTIEDKIKAASAVEKYAAEND